MTSSQLKSVATRVGHGLDLSMDWIGLNWLDWIGSNSGRHFMDWIGLGHVVVIVILIVIALSDCHFVQIFILSFDINF